MIVTKILAPRNTKKKKKKHSSMQHIAQQSLTFKLPYPLPIYHSLSAVATTVDKILEIKSLGLEKREKVLIVGKVSEVQNLLQL